MGACSRFGSRGLMLAMLCYETVCLVSSGSEFFVRKGAPRLDLEFVLSEGIISEWNCFQMCFDVLSWFCVCVCVCVCDVMCFGDW